MTNSNKLADAREFLAAAEGGPANDHGMVPRRTAHAAISAALAHQPEQDSVRMLASQLVDEIDDLMGETGGVYGLHLNGNPSPWGELLPGGRFERLSSLDDLRKALAEHDAQPAQKKWILIPAEPTEKMMEAGEKVYLEMNIADPLMHVWDAMMAVRPKPPAPQPAPAPVQMDNVPRCPSCGYTQEDCLIHWDHRLCGEPDPPAPVQPNNYRDAYEGAREDLLDWKGRAQRAEATLRALGYTGVDASHPPAPAADGAGELLSMIDDVAADLTDHKSLAYEKLRKVRAAIAALRQPVPDANSCAHSWRDDGMVYRSWCSECGSVAVTGYEDQPYAKPLRMDESALASQQESRNGE